LDTKNEEEFVIVIRPDGTVTHIYSDELADVFAGEKQQTRRASHVDPYPGGGWFADMRPSGGPVLWANGSSETVGGNAIELGLTPFALRQDALDAERAWLRRERGL
jgi:hypothetical protein